MNRETTTDQDTLVTFVIPSVGRKTLGRALRSLDAQTDRGFCAVLVMDGCQPPPCAAGFPWLRTVVNGKRIGVRNHAGAVRNVAIKDAATEWLAFLDDDDTLSPNYVEHLRAELGRSERIDAVIFRMRTNKSERRMHPVLPPAGSADLKEGQVGISFSVRRRPLCFGRERVFRFEAGRTEDFVALDWLRKNGAVIAMSPRVAYFVEMEPEDASRHEVGEGAVLNG